MAIQTTRIDDLDGSPDATSVTFALRGKAYEIDLTDKNVEKLQKALQPFIDKARTPGSGDELRRQRTARASGNQVDYTDPKFAGNLHRGRITETEADYVRNNLEAVNARLKAEGGRHIDKNDPDEKKRYNF